MDRSVTRRQVLRAGGTGCALSLAGCLGSGNPVSGGDGGGSGGTAGWPRFQGDAAHSGHTSDSGPASSVGVEWEFDADEYVRAPPVVVDGTVYGEDDDGVFALDAESGDVEWHEDAEEGFADYLTVADGRVYFHRYETGTIALDAGDGSERWRNGDLAENADATVVDGTVYVAEREGALVALDAENGEQEWTFPTEQGVPHPPAVADGTAYFATGEGDGPSYLVAVDVESGEEEWRRERETTQPQCVTVADGSVYAQNMGLESAPADGGERDWRNDDNTVVVRTSVAYADGRVYVGSDRAGDVRENAFAVDAETGETVWERKLDDRVKASPVVADGTMYVVTIEGTVYGLDAESGETRWSQSVDAEVYESPAVADGRLYVPSREGALYALAEQ